MSEKRYGLDVRMDMPKLLIDNNTNEKYNLLMVNDIERIVDLLNEQLSIIRRDEISIKTMMSNMEKLEKENERIKQMYLKKLDKRERQIDIMKFHILNFCTDEQIQSIRNDLEIESKLRRCKK